MAVLTSTCLTCERDFKVTEKEISLAKSFAPRTGDKPLISCGYCGTVYELPADTPDSTKGLKEWMMALIEKEEGWLGCLPLTGIVSIEPISRNEFPPKSGRIYYKPGGGQELDPDYPDGYPRRIYMWMFGLDPAIAWKLMHPIEIKPAEIS